MRRRVAVLALGAAIVGLTGAGVSGAVVLSSRDPGSPAPTAAPVERARAMLTSSIDTPEDAVRAFLDAARSRCSEIPELLTQDSSTRINDLAEWSGDRSGFLLALCQGIAEAISGGPVTIDAGETTGGFGVVTVDTAEAGLAEFSVVREDGTWRIDLSEDLYAMEILANDAWAADGLELALDVERSLHGELGRYSDDIEQLNRHDPTLVFAAGVATTAAAPGDIHVLVGGGGQAVCLSTLSPSGLLLMAKEVGVGPNAGTSYWSGGGLPTDCDTDPLDSDWAGVGLVEA
ncbi:MAG: hypothetical protein HYU28_00670 [Actinobacteria bacterium]|nr:hypothetical protein [Actinomycetota bacterium]